MFTGLVREMGRVEAIAERGGITLLDLSAPATAGTLAIGDSLAVNGICLTVVARSGDRVRVEATEETRRVTTLARWRSGETVHLEPSLRVGDALGGHFVLGHVDGVGRVIALDRRGGAAVMRVGLAPELAAHLLPKGSIAVDGVSLTLDEGPFHGTFSITLVPHTLEATRFAALRPGDPVNLELDVLGKAASAAVERVLGAHDGAGPQLRSAPGGRGSRASSERSGQGRSSLTLDAIRARGWRDGNRERKRGT